MKRTLLALALFSLPVLPSALVAAEADHYTRRDEPLEDMGGIINSMANSYLQTALNLTNKDKDSYCDEDVLYENMRMFFANHSKGALVIFALNSDKVKRRMIPLNESIYEDWGIFNGFLLGRPSASESPLALAPLIRMGRHVIGIDKLEHLFGMGFSYFSWHHLEGMRLSRVLRRGITYEKTALGGNVIATGVYSYGDLTANFNGMRFWNHVLQRRKDVLGGRGKKPYTDLGPYVKCRNGKFEAVKSNPIDLSKYLDESMDEAINCSKFVTRDGTKKIRNSLRRLSSRLPKKLTCPLDQRAWRKMKEKYNVRIKSPADRGTIGSYVLNPNN